MKKTILSALCVFAMIAACKKETKKPEENNTTPTPVTPVTPSNPAGTSNNGIVIAAFKWGGGPGSGVMKKIDLETKATTDLPVPFCTDDYFDVSPDGKKLVYMLQYVDTLVMMYDIATGIKTSLFLKTADISFPAGAHFNEDGSKVLFFNKNKIYSISSTGSVSQSAVLVSTLNGEIGTPFTWTRDGKKMIANGFSGNTNTTSHNICYVDIASGSITRISNGIKVSGNNSEITQAQNEKEPNSSAAVIAQNGIWSGLTYGYRGWTNDGNIYYYSNKDVYQLSGQSPVGINTGVLFKLASPTKTEDSPAYTGMRTLEMSPDGKKYAAITAALNGKMKIFNTSDNSELVDLSSLENSANRFAGLRFANK